MIGTGVIEGKRGQLRLTDATTTTLTNANQYYKIAGTMHDGCSSGFEIINNQLVYNGSDACFLFSGSSDLSVNKACELEYSLYKNNEIVPEAKTPHSFVSSAKTSTIAITALVELKHGDILDVYMKSDTAATIATVHTLNITLWGNI